MALNTMDSDIRRYLLIGCLLLLGWIVPWRNAQANNMCVNVGGPQVVYDGVPASYPSPVPPGQVVWNGPSHTFTVTCSFGGTGTALKAMGGSVIVMAYNPNSGGDSSWYANLEVGDLVNGQQIWFNPKDYVTLADVTVPSCSPGQVCIGVTFQVTEQLNMKYAPGIAKSNQNGNGFTVCVVYKSTGQIAGCGDGATGGPSLWLNPSGGNPQPVTPTCGFQTNNVNIPLGTIQASTLSAPGSSSPWVNGNLVSTGCNAVMQLNMTFSAAADSNNSSLFQATGGASGVGIQLQTADGRAVTPNSSTPLTFAPQPAGGAYGFQARYTRTSAPLGNGEGDAKVTVNITYQ